MNIIIRTNIPIDMFDVNGINKLVANEVLKEVKSLISSGKNTSGQSLHPKKDGSVPDFTGTGTLLNSMKVKYSSIGFVIYIDDASRMEVVSYLSRKWNWTIFHPSKYLETFTTDRYRFYIHESIKKINK